MRYLIPIAADNTLFPKEEFHFPKPLIEINGIPMIGCVVENIQSRDPQAEFIFVVQKRDCVEFSLDAALMLLGGEGTHVVQLDQPTQGAVCSALMAIDFIDDDEPLIICNGDQLIEADLGGTGRYFVGKHFDAGVITFDSIHPRWSYVKKGERGEVLETAEKRVLSRSAIAGYYYFKSGRTFIEAAKTYLQKADPIQGRYFLSPCMNEIILGGGKVGHYDVPTEAYWSFYSPQRIEFYQSSNRVVKARRRADDPRAPTQVVIPMAGRGTRFSAVGYTKPKPFIDVKGMTMIERVMENLRLDNGRFVLIALQDHLDAEPAVQAALEGRPNLTFAPIDFVTEGAACTVMTARTYLDPEAPLLMANCDQIVDFDCEAFVEDAVARGLDGSILVFKEPGRDPKWSYAKTNAAGLVTECREKVAISDDATVGLYYFRRAGDFIAAATDMIVRNDRVNNEFYVCPVYNYAIKNGAKIGVFHIEPEAMHGIGTPDDLNAYLELI